MPTTYPPSTCRALLVSGCLPASENSSYKPRGITGTADVLEKCFRSGGFTGRSVLQSSWEARQQRCILETESSRKRRCPEASHRVSLSALAPPDAGQCLAPRSHQVCTMDNAVWCGANCMCSKQEGKAVAARGRFSPSARLPKGSSSGILRLRYPRSYTKRIFGQKNLHYGSILQVSKICSVFEYYDFCFLADICRRAPWSQLRQVSKCVVEPRRCAMHTLWNATRVNAKVDRDQFVKRNIMHAKLCKPTSPLGAKYIRYCNTKARSPSADAVFPTPGINPILCIWLRERDRFNYRILRGPSSLV